MPEASAAPQNLLFVYGTLLPGHCPDCITDVVARFLPMGRAAVCGVLHDLDAYPGITLTTDASNCVVGELFALPDDPSALRRLDAYEGFDPTAPERSLFCRVKATARLDADGRQLACWVYVYNRSAPPGRIIPSGDWRRRDRTAAAESRGKNRMKRPVIGITLDYRDDKPQRYESSSDYAKSVERAGGVPIYLPFRSDLALIPEIVDVLDGIVFCGGDDLDPSLYGETWHPNAFRLDADRQRFELALMAEIERRRVPALGICLGSQLMNVHRGGSLIQFLPEHERKDAFDHRFLDDACRRHPVLIEPDTILAHAVGKRQIQANTRHKQAVRQVGRGLRVCALSPDGIIEGIEDPSLPLFLGLQWHPENLSEEPEHLAPFKVLVERARDPESDSGAGASPAPSEPVTADR